MTATKPTTKKKFSPLAFTGPTVEEPIPAVTPPGRPDVAPFRPPAFEAPMPRDVEVSKSQDIETPERPEPTASSSHSVPASRARAVMASRRRDAAPPGRIAFTWRLTADQADQLDTMVLELRRKLGRGRLDRAEMLQALVDLASERQDVKEELVKRLQDG